MLGLASCSARENPDLLRQEINVTLLPDSHEVAGKSRITINPHGTSRLSLALAPAASVAGVLVDGKSVPFTFIGGFLTIDLPDGSVDGSVVIEISYRCVFNGKLPSESLSGEDPTYGISAVVSPKGVFLGPGSGWYPSPAMIPAKRSVRITAPAGIEAITAGRRTFRGATANETVSEWSEERPLGDISLSAGSFIIEEKKLDGIPIYTYFTAANSDLAHRYLEASARYIRFYVDLFGPYPFEKFAVVENFFPTGYGFPSYTLLGSSVIRLPFIPETSLPHEIAHSWWGNGVLAEPRGGNWSEGLVTYLSDYLLQERKSPESGREYRTTVLSDYASLVTPERDFPLSEFSRRVDPVSRSIGYGKGMMLFHMLRKSVGDDIFFQGLRDLCRNRLFAAANWDDFIATFARISGKDLSAFTHQWLKRGGGPHVAFAGVTESGKGDNWTVSGVVTQTKPLYSFPLQLELETSSGRIRKDITVTRGRTPFSFELKEPPKRLVLDPDADLFRILFPGEIPPTINRLKGSSSLVAVITGNCRAEDNTIKLLLESLGQGGAAIISEREADEGRIAGHDLLFCGPPIKWDLFKGVTAEGFTIGREIFNQREDALFAVARNPLDRERVAGIFHPLSRKGANDSFMKITHYGKYSYVAFSEGRSRLKGVAATPSPESDILFDAGR